MIQLKRIYDEPDAADGVRLLVDRLWPRGLSRESARVDRWLKELAPSTELRRWFGHDPARWQEFKERYQRELRDQGDLLDEVRQQASRERVTLLYAAKDDEHNNAVVLKELLKM